MDFSLSDEQKIMLASAKSFLGKEAKDLYRKMEENKTQEGYSPDIWRKMADLGWLGIVFPEEVWGTGGGFVDLVLLIEETGRALLPGPYIPTMISGLAILKYGSEEQKTEMLAKIVEGNCILSYALTEPDPCVPGNRTEEKVTVDSDGSYIISGTRLFAPFAHVAHWLLYETDTGEGKTLFLVNTKSLGVTFTPFESIAVDKLCEVNLKEVKVPKDCILGKMGNGNEITSDVKKWGALSESAYITGMLEWILETTVAYAKERVQFGSPIGSFQAIQHQCANMATDIDRTKFLTYRAACELDDGQSAESEVSMAKAWASDSARRVSLLGCKIHGGVGISKEHDMTLYFCKAKACELSFGGGDFHREIVAERLGLS